MFRVQNARSRRNGINGSNNKPTRNSRLLIKFTVSSAILIVLWLYLSVVHEYLLTYADRRSLSIAADAPTNSTATTRRLGILVGIFTTDLPNDQEYRLRHRKLFTLWNDPRVCILSDFQRAHDNNNKQKVARCELIYTFVVGANPEAPPEWMEQDPNDNGNRLDNPILAPSKMAFNYSSRDLYKRDVTHLNIRENMNDGKSQTWFKYAYNVMQSYPEISYAMKLDADALLHLHEFFHFAYHHLPPPPYSDNAYVGSLRDKAFWPKKRNVTKSDRAQLEGYFGTEFEGVHLYLAGQCYILSKNLARIVKIESQNLHRELADEQKSNATYLEGVEDHDIAAMVLHNPESVHLIMVRKNQRFWEHPVKGEPRWRRIWQREVARMEGKPFENKWYTKDSSFEAVMAADGNDNNA